MATSDMPPESQMSGEPVRWVVCDAVGTLIYPVPDVATVYHRIGRKHGSLLGRNEVAIRFQAAFREAELRDNAGQQWADGRRTDTAEPLQTSERIEVRRWQRIVATVLSDVDSPVDCFEELFAHFGRSSSWSCFPETQAALMQLQQQGIRLAIASNFDSRLHQVCDGLAPFRQIEHCVVSSEVGFRKPSRLFYDAVLRCIDSPPDQVLMVGDDLQNDVRGAQSAGIRAALICREDCDDLPTDVTVVKDLLEIETLL